jgi:hypothetical protein
MLPDCRGQDVFRTQSRCRRRTPERQRHSRICNPTEWKPERAPVSITGPGGFASCDQLDTAKRPSTVGLEGSAAMGIAGQPNQDAILATL